MRTDQKPWGICQHCADGPVEVDLLEVKNGGYSSIHRHNGKTNLFLLISGAVDVLVFDRIPEWVAGREDEASTTCEPDRVLQLRDYGDTAQIAPGIWHQFRVLADAVIVEVYFSAFPDPSDIQRATMNGRVESWPMKNGRPDWEPK